MGLLDKIVEAAHSIAGEMLNQNTIEGFKQLITGEGIEGLMKKFKSLGMDEVLSSWIGTGKNLPISKDQILKVFGEDKIKEFSEKTGVTMDKSQDIIKDMLPGIIDKISPNGKIEE